MAKRQIFYSFDYDHDVFRVQQICNMGSFDNSEPVSPNDWETVEKGDDKAIQKWIDDNMKSRSCVVVLIGEQTASSRWVKYEIEKAWNDKKGLVGVYIHNLKCPRSGYSYQGSNPFEKYKVGETKLSDIVKCYDPISLTLQSMFDPEITTGKVVYNHIRDNISDWVEEAIEIRNNN